MNKTGTVTIETPRLILRRFRPDDAQDMFDNWASDPEVTKFLSWPTHTGVDVSARVLGDWAAAYENDDCFSWAIEYKETGRAVGSIGVIELNAEIEAAVVGYCISRACWGKGLMTEALKAVLDYLFDTVGLNRVAAYHDARNPASGRVMEKAGMKLEGILRQSHKNNSGVCDTVWRSMLKSDRADRA